MRSYVKRISKKLSKLSREQLELLVNESLSENESLYAIMESLSTGLIIVDNHFYLQQSNTIVESQLAFSTFLDSQEVLEKPIWEFISDKDISDFFLKCSKKNSTNATEEFSTVTAGGIVRFITITMTPLINQGNLTGRIFLVRDITEKRNQDVLLHRMESMANLTNLAAGMAHDIKNPLGAISIHIQLIQKALEKARNNNDILPPKKFVEDHIDVVNEEIDHLNKLVMDFLFAVRPVNAQLQLKDPAKIIESTVNFIKPEFNKYNIEVIFNHPDEVTKVMVDEKLLKEVIMNLSQNGLYAIKAKFPECEKEISFEENHTFTGKFTIDCSVQQQKYYIKVSDNGTGMSSETSAKIFEPYYTTKSNGTGLGMTMVYKIVKEFSGEIQVDSEFGKGTSFIMIFPIPQDNKKLLNCD